MFYSLLFRAGTKYIILIEMNKLVGTFNFVYTGSPSLLHDMNVMS